MLDLLQDRIAAVRLQAAHLAASITEHLMKDPNQNDDFVYSVSRRSLINFND